MLREHYQVKINTKNGPLYGIVDLYSDEAKKAAKNGKCVVDGAVKATRFQVPESELIDLPMDFGGEYEKHVEEAQVEAQKLSDSIKGFNPGKLFAVGVADGSAWYVVTKVTKTTATIEWRGFCMDRWTDRCLGYGGTFKRSMIKNLCCSMFQEPCV